MRVSLILGLSFTIFFLDGSSGQANKAAFSKKIIKLAVPFFTEKEMGKIFDKLSLDIYNELPIQNISSKVLGYLASETPILKYGQLLSMMSKNDGCLKSANVEDRTMGILVQFGEIMAEMLKKPYNQIKTKAVQCKTNKVEQAKCFEQMYKIATSCTTKDLVQKIVTKCANTLKCPVWGCACIHVTGVMRIQDYNTTRTKKC